MKCSGEKTFKFQFFAFECPRNWFLKQSLILKIFWKTEVEKALQCTSNLNDNNKLILVAEIEIRHLEQHLNLYVCKHLYLCVWTKSTSSSFKNILSEKPTCNLVNAYIFWTEHIIKTTYHFHIRINTFHLLLPRSEETTFKKEWTRSFCFLNNLRW